MPLAARSGALGQTRAATASDVIRVLQRSGQPTTLGRAIAELGRIVQTITMLAYVSDEAARRRVLVQLNRTEARHDLARAVFHGRGGICTRRIGPARRTSSEHSGWW